MLRSLVTGLIVFCLAGPAASAWTAHAAVTELSFQVVDLAPDDGLEASATIGSGSTFYFTRGPDALDLQEREFLPAKTLINGGASVTSGPELLHSEVHYREGTLRSWHTANAKASAYVTVSPHTSLTFSGMLSTGADCPSPCTYRSGEASVELYHAFGETFELVGSQYAESGSLSGGRPSQPGYFAFTFENQGAEAARLAVYVGAVASLNPVPEPATSVLFAAGVAALCACARRRIGRDAG